MNASFTASAYTANEAAIATRAKSWVPKNIRDLAKVDPGAARDMLTDLMAEILMAEEQNGKILDTTQLFSFFQGAIGTRKTERFAYALMDQGRNLLSKGLMPVGSATRCVLYPRQLFTIALKAGATAMVIAHNHPGGTLTPSPADRELTRRLDAQAEGLEIQLLDHIIVTKSGSLSMREAGYM